MFKLQQKPEKHVVKSFEIKDLYCFIVNNHKECNEYDFLIGYDPISADDFLKLFLVDESTNYMEYLELYQILKTTETIYYYG